MILPYDNIQEVFPGTVIYPPGGTFGPRYQPDIQFVLLHTGSMRVQIDDSTLDCPPGFVAMLLPGHTESFEFHQLKPTWHRWIAIRPGNAEAASRRLAPLPRILPLTEEFNRVTDILLSLRDKQQLTSAVGKALGNSAIQLYAQMASLVPQEAAVHPSVTAVKEAVHRRYGEDLSLEELAQEAGVSPEHLVRLFRRHEQTTPMRYVWHYRVLAASDMLAHTGLSVGEIAALSGFKTSYHFARMFKQQMGMSPSQARAQAWLGKIE